MVRRDGGHENRLGAFRDRVKRDARARARSGQVEVRRRKKAMRLKESRRRVAQGENL